MCRPVAVGLLPALISLIAAGLNAQTRWVDLTGGAPGPGRYGAEFAFDPVNQTLLMQGGSGSGPNASVRTWNWDGQTWTPLAVASPSFFFGSAMAADTVRNRVVLFGGPGVLPGLSADTWEWDGSSWTRMQPANTPGLRFGRPAMAFDERRGVTVFYGGSDLITPSADTQTWEWDGINWTLASPASGTPPPMWSPAMAYDPVRQRIVLVGNGQTYEWDGVVWVQRTTAAAPPFRHGTRMAFDVNFGRMVLFGGSDTNNQVLGDTWTWDGFAWTQMQPPYAPEPRRGMVMAADASGRVFLHGGQNSVGATLDDTWEWIHPYWVPRARAATAPVTRTDAGLAFCPVRREPVLFGGFAGSAYLGDMWAFTANGWAELTPTTLPSPRNRFGFCAVPVRGEIVQFGGFTGSVFPTETWIWNGIDWTQRTTSTAPPGRMFPGMVYDSRRDRVVLFGGMTFTNFFNDTWEYDGTTWIDVSPAMAPGPRHTHSMAYDPLRGRTVMFGGRVPPQWLGTDETWEWDGASWTLVQTVNRPPPRSEQMMTWDAARERVVMFGGFLYAVGNQDDTWEYDGADWRQLNVNPAPPPRVGAAFTHDPRQHVNLLFSGSGLRDTWIHSTVQAAVADPFGSGCAGTVGVPALATENGRLPWIGQTTTLTVSGVPASGAVGLAMGFSEQMWGQVALPLLLGPAMPGCSVLVSPDVMFGLLADPSGVARLPLPVPNSPSFVGVAFASQALAVDPGANAAGAVLSNGLRLRVGAR